MTKRILAIDTTTEFGSIALVAMNGGSDAAAPLAGEVVEEVLLHSKEGFGHILYEHVGALLDRAGCKIEEIDCFAAAAGPGSFTGVRVGLAAVKGFAAALGKPAAAVSNLQALASFGAAPLRAVVLDARRNEIYAAVYGRELEAISPEVVTRFPEWLDTLPEGELEFVASDFDPFRNALAGTRFAQATVRQAPRALAGGIGRIAASRFAAGRACDPAAVDANYVRRADAELAWKDRR